MELERRFIERTDFSSVRRGYDPGEVDAHLREVAEAVAALRQARGQAGVAPAAPVSAMASAAGEQVRAIVEAAERGAGEIEAAATEEADRVTGEATRQAEQERSTARGEADRVLREAEQAARATRERAEAEAAQHVAGVKDATAGMRTRAEAVESDLGGLVDELRGTLESDLGGLVDELRGTLESVVDSVRSRAGSLETELAGAHAALAEAREARPAPGPVAATGLDPHPDAGVAPAAQPTVATEAVQPDAAPAPRPADVGFEDDDERDADPADDEGDAAAAPRDDEPDARDAGHEPAAAQPSSPAASSGGESAEGARLIALNMALNGTPRQETARYLEENFDLEDQDAILDEVYARVGG